jgi:DNA-directed RNA polymerase specialized sigma54-like protein
VEGDETKAQTNCTEKQAEKTGQYISTISRVVNSKNIQNPFLALYSLKNIFSEGLMT